MDQTRDFTIDKGLGVRIRDSRTCQVIRHYQGEWKEIGREYALPVLARDLLWTASGIPATTLAVAVRAFELDNPGSSLREILTRSKEAAKRSEPRPGRERHVVIKSQWLNGRAVRLVTGGERQ